MEPASREGGEGISWIESSLFLTQVQRRLEEIYAHMELSPGLNEFVENTAHSHFFLYSFAFSCCLSYR